MNESLRVAAAQARPVWLDPGETAKKVVAWLQDAAARQVELVAFPETFLSGYPFWVELTDGARFDDPAQKRAYAAYLDAAIVVDGPELGLVVEAARDLGVFVYLGVTERGAGVASGTVFCTLMAIDPAQGVVGTHRKLVPTYEERLVWGMGDGHGLRTHRVGGARVGGRHRPEHRHPLGITLPGVLRRRMIDGRKHCAATNMTIQATSEQRRETMDTDTTTRSPEALRAQMVEKVRKVGHAHRTEVGQVLLDTPRHEFVSDADLDLAYDPWQAVITHRYDDGRSLSCASAPWLVAAMLDQLEARRFADS